jgi:hypothetical protein
MLELPLPQLRRLAVVLPLAALSCGAVASSASAGTTISFGSGLQRAGVSAPSRVVLATGASRQSAAGTVVDLTGTVKLRAGSRTATLSGLRVTTQLRSQIAAKVNGGARRTLFTVSGSTVSLTRTGASTLTRALGRRLRAVAVGRIALDPAAATGGGGSGAPAGAGARTITGGTISWGYSPALRTVFQAAFTPLVSGGVTQAADGTFALPVTGGSYAAATRRGSVTSKGGFRIGYQISPADAAGAHGIWVTLGNVAIALDGTRGVLTATSESGYHGTAVVAMAPRTIATLDLSAAPTASADGSTLTWTAAPATIAPGGEELVAAFQDAPGRPSLGNVRALDPVTITVTLAP